MRLDEVLTGLGRPVMFYPKFAKALGREESIFVAQLIYWHGMGSDPEWTYKTSEDIENETGLSYREQLRVRKNLTKNGILVEKYKKFENKFYFQINTEKLNNMFEMAIDSHKNEARHERNTDRHDDTTDRHDDTTDRHERKSVYIHRVHIEDTESTKIQTPNSEHQTGNSLIAEKTLSPMNEKFYEFWKLYPNKKGKEIAKKAWKKVDPDDYAAIFAALPNHISSDQWRSDSGRFIPMLSTWLNQKRWEDDMGPIQVQPIKEKRESDLYPTL